MVHCRTVGLTPDSPLEGILMRWEQNSHIRANSQSSPTMGRTCTQVCGGYLQVSDPVLTGGGSQRLTSVVVVVRLY